MIPWADCSFIPFPIPCFEDREAKQLFSSQDCVEVSGNKVQSLSAIHLMIEKTIHLTIAAL